MPGRKRPRSGRRPKVRTFAGASIFDNIRRHEPRQPTNDPPPMPLDSPLAFRPLLKRALWGGRRLAGVLGKSIGPEPDFAESWEIVDHGTDQSVVAGGP